MILLDYKVTNIILCIAIALVLDYESRSIHSLHNSPSCEIRLVFCYISVFSVHKLGVTSLVDGGCVVGNDIPVEHYCLVHSVPVPFH